MLDNSEWIFGTYKLNVITWLELLLLCMVFYLCSYSDFFYFLDKLSKSHYWEKKEGFYKKGFYNISTFVGYLTPNPFYTNKQFYFKQFSLVQFDP